METKVFTSLDRDGDGVLRINEVKQLFFNIGVKITDDDINKLVSVVTAGTCKDIDSAALTQFIAESAGASSSEEGADLFRVLSKKQKGFVTADEIRATLEANGVSLTDEEAGELVLQHKKRSDTPKDALSAEEFIAMLS